MSDIKIVKIDEMIKNLKEMKKEILKMNKLNDIGCDNATIKQFERKNAEANSIGISLIKRKHELHALAVEIGFSERRESYDSIELSTGWHTHEYKPREPD